MTHTKNMAIKISEKFMSMGVRSLDSKNRISLGDRIRKLLLKTMKVDAFEVLLGEEGDVLLRPVTNIPSKEAWIYQNPDVLGKISKGLQEAKAGKIEKVNNLDKFFDSL